MRNLLLSSLALLAILAVSIHTHAQAVADDIDQDDFQEGDVGAAPNADSDSVPGLRMQLPSYGGSGCPQGTMQAALSPDQKTLSLLFDQYIAEATGASKVRANAQCQIKIPFLVPAGYRVQVVKMDYRGFVSVPAGGRSSFAAGFSYLELDGVARSTSRNLMRRKIFGGPRQSQFQVTSVMKKEHWSPCGKNFVLAAESEIMAQTNRGGEQVLTTVDSLDTVQVPVAYSLRWKRCQDKDEKREAREQRKVERQQEKFKR